jgi:hypothetical protein
MNLKDQMNLRRLLIVFCEGLAQYPNDKERAEKGIQIIQQWVDEVVNRECSTLFQKNAVITHRGQKKGGGGSIN